MEKPLWKKNPGTAFSWLCCSAGNGVQLLTCLKKNGVSIFWAGKIPKPPDSQQPQQCRAGWGCTGAALELLWSCSGAAGGRAAMPKALATLLWLPRSCLPVQLCPKPATAGFIWPVKVHCGRKGFALLKKFFLRFFFFFLRGTYLKCCSSLKRDSCLEKKKWHLFTWEISSLYI